MNRRELIGTAATAGALALAGCSNAPGGDGGDGGGGGGGDGSGGDGAGDGSDGGGGGDADLYIAQAVSKLNAVALRLNKEKAALDSPDEDVDLDEETLFGAIDTAREKLDTASESATDEQSAQIETLRNLATALENQVRLVVLVDDVDADTVAEETQTAVDNRNYDTALSRIRDAQETAETADEYANNAETALEGVEPDRLEAVDGVEYAKVAEGVSQTGALVDAFVVLTDSYEAAIMGAQDLEAGRDHIELKEYEAAEADFSSARTHFEAADETLTNASDDPDQPDDLAAKIEIAQCQVTHLVEASKAFEEGAAYGSDGNLAKARERKQDGEAAYDDVSNCGDDSSN